MNDLSFAVGRLQVGPPHIVGDIARAHFILRGIAAAHGLEASDLRNRDLRAVKFQNPRREAMALICAVTALSQGRVAMIFGLDRKAVGRAVERQAAIDAGLKPYSRRAGLERSS